MMSSYYVTPMISIGSTVRVRTVLLYRADRMMMMFSVGVGQQLFFADSKIASFSKTVQSPHSTRPIFVIPAPIFGQKKGSGGICYYYYCTFCTVRHKTLHRQRLKSTNLLSIIEVEAHHLCPLSSHLSSY